MLALAFMTLFGVGAVALAQFGSASFQAVAAVRDQGESVYAAEGAVDTSIANVRHDSAAGGSACPTLTMPSVAGHAITATCSGQATTGGAAAGVNAPAQALLTLATGAEDGITLTQGAGRLGINGTVFSNSGITANPGVLDAGSFSITARGACAKAGNVVGASVNCNVGSGGHPEGNDPNYPSALSTLPAHHTVPGCGAGNRVISMSPGFYDDAAGLTNLTGGGCANAVVWFQPGAYYFDFDLAGGTNTWTVSDSSVNVVGGTPNGWSATAPSRPTISAPGGCKRDGDPTPNAGVQFVFGADSHLVISAGVVELCATPSTTSQEISLYGLKTGTATSTTATLTPAPGGAGASSISGWPNLLTPKNAIDAIDNTVTSGTISGNNATASMTLSGYASSIPAGSAITSVQLRVAHRESTTAPALASLTATANGTGGSCTVNVTARATLGTDALYPCTGITTLAQLANLKVVYAAKLASSGNPNATLDLDGIEVVVTYTPPALRAESGCVSTVGGCTLVTVTSKFAAFYSSGTVYAPLASFDFDLQNTTGLQVQRGAIVRSITFRNPPATNPPVPSMSLPPSGRSVVFVGAVDGTRRVRAVVNFNDAPTVGAQATVTSWTVNR